MKKTKNVINSDKKYPYWFLIPGILIFGVFYIYPVFSGIFYSFTYWDFRTFRFAGLANYEYILGHDYYRIAFSNTIVFTVLSTVFGFIVALALALFLMKKLHLGSYFKTVSYLPVIINFIAVGITFTALLHPSDGIVNQILVSIGLEQFAFDWFFDTRFSLLTMALIQTWKNAGFFMLIFLAGLSAIDISYYEAATIDGANSFQKFSRITMPLLLPQINNVTVLLLVRGFKVFDIVMATTGGGPGNQTSSLSQYAYDALASGRAGESSAAMVLLAILCGVVGIGLANFLRKREVEL